MKSRPMKSRTRAGPCLVAAFPRRSAVGGIVEPNILALRLTICGEVSIGGSSENGDHASHSVFQRSRQVSDIGQIRI